MLRAKALRNRVWDRFMLSPHGHLVVWHKLALHFGQLKRVLLTKRRFSLTNKATAEERSSRGAPPPSVQVTLEQLVLSPRPCSPRSEHKTTWLRRLSTSWLQVEANSAVVRADRTVDVAMVTGATCSAGPGGPGGPWPIARLLWPWLGLPCPVAVSRASSSSTVVGSRGSVSSPASTWRRFPPCWPRALGSWGYSQPCPCPCSSQPSLWSQVGTE